MKRGICLTAVYPEAMHDAELLIELLQKVSRTKIFNCVEFYFEGSPAKQKKIKDCLEKESLHSVFLAGYYLKKNMVNITSPVEEERVQGVEICKELYRQAIHMGTDKMLILSGSSWEIKNEKKLVGQTQKTLVELSQIMRDFQTEITLEFFNDSGEPNLAIGKPDLITRVYEHLPGNKVGITFDTSHVVQMKEEVVNTFFKLRPWIRHLHLANSITLDTEHPLFGDKHPMFDEKEGDISLNKIRNLYEEMEAKAMLKNVDISSLEIVSRGREDWYFDSIVKQAAYIWQKALIERARCAQMGAKDESIGKR